MNRIRLFPKDFLKAAFSIGLPIALQSFITTSVNMVDVDSDAGKPQGIVHTLCKRAGDVRFPAAWMRAYGNVFSPITGLRSLLQQLSID